MSRGREDEAPGTRRWGSRGCAKWTPTQGQGRRNQEVRPEPNSIAPAEAQGEPEGSRGRGPRKATVRRAGGMEAKPALPRRGAAARERGPRWPRAAGGRVPRPAPSPCASPSRGKMETGPESGRSSQEMGGELRSQERRGRSERSAPEVQPYPRAVPPNTGLPSCNSASSQKAWVAVDCLRGRLREPHSQRGDKTRSWSIWVLGHIRASPGPP